MEHDWQEKPLRRIDARLWECACGTTAFGATKPRGGDCRGVPVVTMQVLSPPCIYRSKEVARHGCCGAPVTLIYGCSVRSSCTLEENDGTLEWNGEPVAACEGCEKRNQ